MLLNYSLDRLQTLFQNVLNKKLKDKPTHVLEANMKLLLAHEANMLIVPNQHMRINGEVNVAFYLKSLENEVVLQVEKNGGKAYFTDLLNLVHYYRKQWVSGL